MTQRKHKCSIAFLYLSTFLKKLKKIMAYNIKNKLAVSKKKKKKTGKMLLE